MADNTEFAYRRIPPDMFRFGQVRVEDFFIVEAEKALLDTLYMKSKGLAELLPEDIDMAKLDDELLNYYIRLYPDIVKKMLNDVKARDYEAK